MLKKKERENLNNISTYQTDIIMPLRSKKQGSKKGKGKAAHQPDLPKRRKREEVSHSSDEAASPQQQEQEQEHQQEPHSGSEAEAGAGQQEEPSREGTGEIYLHFFQMLLICFISFVSFAHADIIIFFINLCLYISSR